MDREMARACGSFAAFVERHATGEAYEGVLDEAEVDYGVILAELAPITSAIGSNETVARLCAGHPRLIPFASLNPYLVENPARELQPLPPAPGVPGLHPPPTHPHISTHD